MNNTVRITAVNAKDIAPNTNSTMDAKTLQMAKDLLFARIV